MEISKHFDVPMSAFCSSTKEVSVKNQNTICASKIYAFHIRRNAMQLLQFKKKNGNVINLKQIGGHKLSKQISYLSYNILSNHLFYINYKVKSLVSRSPPKSYLEIKFKRH